MLGRLDQATCRLISKDQWGWADWRNYETDMSRVIWEYVNQIGIMAEETHYGD